MSQDEQLPENWPVAGTTGYDFASLINDIIVDPQGLTDIDRIYRSTTGETRGYKELVYVAKRRVLKETFTANVQSLTTLLAQIAVHDRHGRDLTVESLRASLIEVTASLPVYRTYINSFEVSDQDRHWIDEALERSSARRPDLRHTLAFLRRVLLLRMPPYIGEDDRAEWLRFVMRWQQFTGPAMAKGSEDTALYQYNRLLTLNEVGGEPDSAGSDVEKFHAHNLRIQRDWPQTLNALSTHYTQAK